MFAPSSPKKQTSRNIPSGKMTEDDLPTGWVQDSWEDSEHLDDNGPSTVGSSDPASVSKLDRRNKNQIFNPLISFGRSLFGKDLSQISPLASGFFEKKLSSSKGNTSVLVPLLGGNRKEAQGNETIDEEPPKIDHLHSLNVGKFRHSLDEAYNSGPQNLSRFLVEESKEYSTGSSFVSSTSDALGSMGRTFKSMVPSFPKLFQKEKLDSSPRGYEEDEVLSEESISCKHKAMEVLPVLAVVTLGVLGTFMYLVILNTFWPETRAAFSLSCQISDGKWVHSPSSKTRYSPSSCPFIRESWNCASGVGVSKRTNLQWEVNECVVPRFSANRFFESWKNKKIAFIGDSSASNIFDSFLCLLSKEELPKIYGNQGTEDVSNLNGNSAELKEMLRKAWNNNRMEFYFPQSNFSMVYFNSPFLVSSNHQNSTCGEKLETRGTTSDDGKLTKETPINCTKVELFLDDVDPLWSSEVPYFDALVFSSDQIWEKSSDDGKNVLFSFSEMENEGKTVDNALSAIPQVVKTVGSFLDHNYGGNVVFKSFVGFRDKEQCSNSVSFPDKHVKEIQEQQHFNGAIKETFKGPKSYILNVTTLSKIGGENDLRHGKTSIGMKNCSSWCLPGVPDTWNDILAAALLEMSI